MLKKIFPNSFPRGFIFLVLILFLSSFLRFYNITTIFPFNGDVAWDFLSAESFLKGGPLPLVGISSSIPWLHQGAFFTYVLIVILGLFKGNPIAPVFFTAALGVLTTFLIYFAGKKIFSEKVGLWSALFYSVSPLTVFFDRFPYHLSPIAILSLFFFWSLFKATNGKPKIFIISSLLFGVLLQFELSNLVLLPVILTCFWWKRKDIPIKNVILSIFSFVLPWLPKIIYDFSNGFTQTLGYFAWVGHKMIPVGGMDVGKSMAEPLVPNLKLFFQFLSKAIFPINFYVSTLIFVLLLLFLVLHLKTKKKQEDSSAYLLFLFLVIPVFCFLIMGSSSESYLPVLFPGIALLFGFTIEKLTNFIKPSLVALIVVLFLFFNGVYLLRNNFLVKGDQFSEVKLAAEFIVKDAQNNNFNIIPMGSYAEFPSNKLNLVYLTAYFGHPPNDKEAKNKYFVYNSGEQRPIIYARKVFQFSDITIFKKND